jgi:hypothetical protein
LLDCVLAGLAAIVPKPDGAAVRSRTFDSDFDPDFDFGERHWRNVSVGDEWVFERFPTKHA